MPWYNKEQPTPADSLPISGLEFLHGDVLARQYRQAWVEGKKYPLITFPSGVQREFRSSNEHLGGAVHIFDGFVVNYAVSRNDAYEQASKLTSQGYVVARRGEDAIRIRNPYSRRSYILTFDAQAHHLANIELYPEHAMELLGGAQRALLPPLSNGDNLNLDTIAPLKFFTPDANWTWYPTEFDGDDIFFGLASGNDVEFGIFALSDLESIRGGFGLPLERDRYYKPTSLRELIEYHKRQLRLT